MRPAGTAAITRRPGRASRRTSRKYASGSTSRSSRLRSRFRLTGIRNRFARPRAMSLRYDRRSFLTITGGALATAAARRTIGAEQVSKSHGLVVGHPEANAAGMRVLAEGGNAVDAIVSAALVAGVVAVCALRNRRLRRTHDDRPAERQGHVDRFQFRSARGRAARYVSARC